MLNYHKAVFCCFYLGLLRTGDRNYYESYFLLCGLATLKKFSLRGPKNKNAILLD
jgi:hypothetical protein